MKRIINDSICIFLILAVNFSFSGCQTTSTREDYQSLYREVNVSENVFELFRPLDDNTQKGRRDEELKSMLKSWYTNVRLANEYHTLPFNEKLIAQISNVRPNTNGYLTKIWDKELLLQILQKAHNISLEVFEYFTDNFNNIDIEFGNFYWLRKIARDHLSQKTPVIGQFRDQRAYEIYWLDIWTRHGNIISPTIRVYYDSVALINPQNLGEEFPITVREEPLFLELDNIIMTWHELADEMNITNNYFYLSACFRGIFSVEGDSPVSVFTGSDSTYKGALFTSPLIGPDVYKELNFNPALPLLNQYVHWDLPNSELNKLANFNSIELLTWLQCDNLRNVPAESVHTISQALRDENLSPEQVLATLPLITEVPKPGLVESSPEGRNFLYLISQTNPAATYIGEGLFSVEFKNTEITASQNGERNSAFNIVLLAETAATPGGAVVAGSGASAAAVVNRLVDLGTERGSERDENLLMLARLAEEVCVPGSTTTSECIECMKSLDLYKEEIAALGRKRNIEFAGSVVAVGAGCAVGAAVGVWGFGIGAAIGCVIGAAAGLLVSAAEAWSDYKTYKDDIRETNKQAFAPCYSLM